MVWKPYGNPHVMSAATTESRLRHLAPLPRQIETVALRYEWMVVAIRSSTLAIDLVGTTFGFRYYVP